MLLLVGLGNPGSNYTNTRHNIGFKIIDAINAHFKLSKQKPKFKGLLTTGSIEEKKIYAIKPLTFMNNSGTAIKELIDYFKIDAKDVIVFHDDMDIDFGKINHYSGNYTFWYESSQLAARQRAQQNKKAEEKKKELEEFIARFSANVAKSKQATSRKKMIDKLNIHEIKPSSRRYPAIIFEREREAGDQILNIENLSKSIEDELLFSKIDLNLVKGDKVLLYSKDSRATTSFYQIINEKLSADSGNYKWGITTNHSYLPLDNSEFFNKNISLVDWLRNWAQTEEEREEVYLRGFLGKMIFSGEEALKKCTVLSGGEKVRCMLSKMMMKKGNVLILDEPTNHLDLESITAFNNSLKKFKGTVLFSTHDHQFAQTIANRIVELTPNGVIDRYMKFDEYMNDDKIKELRASMY